MRSDWVKKTRVEPAIRRNGILCHGRIAVALRLRERVDDDNVALFKVGYEGMKVLEVETTAGVIAALEKDGDRLLSNKE